MHIGPCQKCLESKPVRYYPQGESYRLFCEACAERFLGQKYSYNGWTLCPRPGALPGTTLYALFDGQGHDGGLSALSEIAGFKLLQALTDKDRLQAQRLKNKKYNKGSK